MLATKCEFYKARDEFMTRFSLHYLQHSVTHSLWTSPLHVCHQAEGGMRALICFAFDFCLKVTVMASAGVEGIGRHAGFLSS
jgi:hypothetical protein